LPSYYSVHINQRYYRKIYGGRRLIPLQKPLKLSHPQGTNDQGGSFYKNRPLDPRKNFYYEKFWEVSEGAGSPSLLSMLITVRLEPLLRAKSQLPTAKSNGSDPPEAKILLKFPGFSFKILL
jgi:hypothetical protein